MDLGYKRSFVTQDLHGADFLLMPSQSRTLWIESNVCHEIRNYPNCTIYRWVKRYHVTDISSGGYGLNYTFQELMMLYMPSKERCIYMMIKKKCKIYENNNEFGLFLAEIC